MKYYAPLILVLIVGYGIGRLHPCGSDLDSLIDKPFADVLHTELTREAAHPAIGEFYYVWPSHCDVDPVDRHSIMLRCHAPALKQQGGSADQNAPSAEAAQ